MQNDLRIEKAAPSIKKARLFRAGGKTKLLFG